jgi:hypothetical protein
VTRRDPQQASTDRREGLAWAGLGAAILVMSLLMDRLPEQGVRPYAAPGLMPGLLGIAMMLFGGLVAMRAGRGPGGGEGPIQRPQAVDFGRLALVIGLCLTFSVVLIGHGLPFWLASTLFVSTSILVLQHPERRVARRRLDARAVIIAGVIGLAVGVMATLVFQDLFLVRLP